MHDYVIIGAGSAGCVLANRLSEDPGTSVLLLEAGPRDTKQEIHIPLAFSKLFKSPLDWAYETEAEQQLNGRALYWPRGKVLGGSSSLNAMVYHRGHPSDYDGWHEQGNTGWGYADVLPYFKKAEDFERGASQYHGVGGPLHVSELRSVNQLSRAFLMACDEVGLPRTDDFNGPHSEGTGPFQVTQKRGKRDSAADAYLKPALHRPNLTVHTSAHVTRVLFEGTRAIGVACMSDGRDTIARAGREVLLCGGAVNSPQLLMLSGVGPADHLNALALPIVADLPGVGSNLQDHLAVGVVRACTQPVSLASAESLRNVLEYLLFHRGPLTSNVAEVGGFLRTHPDLIRPDLEVMFIPVYFLGHGFNHPTPLSGHGFTLAAILLHPVSRGRITLRSSNPSDYPFIQANYLSAEADVQVLVEGTKLCRTLTQSPAFDAYRGAEIAPGPQAESDRAIAEAMRAFAETLYHPVGTCKMGGDAMAVVDEQLRVRGVEGLRVVDASIMPEIVGGHTNAPTIMIAEKAADLIRGRIPPGTKATQAALATPVEQESRL